MDNKIYPPRHTVNFACSKALHNKIKKLAAKEQRSVSSYIRAVILKYMAVTKTGK